MFACNNLKQNEIHTTVRISKTVLMMTKQKCWQKVQCHIKTNNRKSSDNRSKSGQNISNRGRPCIYCHASTFESRFHCNKGHIRHKCHIISSSATNKSNFVVKWQKSDLVRTQFLWEFKSFNSKPIWNVMSDLMDLYIFSMSRSTVLSSNTRVPNWFLNASFMLTMNLADDLCWRKIW